MTATLPGGTILLVEDDPPTRSLISRILQNQGYQLLEACNGVAGLSLAANHDGPIDLLVTDIVMPHMDGFTLSERLVESRPGTRVLFMSGYADRSTAVRGGLKQAGHPFLVKPFTRDSLLQTVREQLDGAPNARRDRDTPQPDQPLSEPGVPFCPPNQDIFRIEPEACTAAVTGLLHHGEK